MTLLITGGTGFVMSNLARRWLDADADARVVVLDAGRPSDLAGRFFAGVDDRIEVIRADVRHPEGWHGRIRGGDIRHVVHGATITTLHGAARVALPGGGERADPQDMLDVNIMGTVRLADWASRLPGLERFVYVSSGSVYADQGPADAPLPEDGHVAPDGFYAIGKYASELITQRFADEFGLPALSVRLSGVYGPMDRVTESRDVRCAPNRIAHLALAGETIRVNDAGGVGDWIHAGDVAEALRLLLRAPAPAHPVYNIAYGEAVTIGALIEIVAQHVPGTRWAVVGDDDANVVHDARRRLGRWGAYDITRLTDGHGWRPRPLAEAMHAYIDWVAAHEAA